MGEGWRILAVLGFVALAALIGAALDELARVSQQPDENEE